MLLRTRGDPGEPAQDPVGAQSTWDHWWQFKAATQAGQIELLSHQKQCPSDCRGTLGHRFPIQPLQPPLCVPPLTRLGCRLPRDMTEAGKAWPRLPTAAL